MAPATLILERIGHVAHVRLNRPQVHNAFDEHLIGELTSVMRTLGDDADVRAIVLSGNGKSFCAGGDLNWMKRTAGYSREENVEDGKRLARMLQTVNNLPKPVIGRIHGNVFGGGTGLVACCDIAIAATSARFSFSEVKLGLIPATISPYVVAAIGARTARRYFLTGERFDGAEAVRIGLVHEAVAEDALDARTDELLKALATSGPVALGESKALIRYVAGREIDESVMQRTAEWIAETRASDEGREGISAFLDKRRPRWVEEAS